MSATVAGSGAGAGGGAVHSARPVLENGPALGLLLLFAYLTKAANSRLEPDQLLWIAAPTRALVSVVTGLEFVHEAGYGYVNLDHRLVIAKSCLGMNYLVAVLGMLAFTTIPTARGPGRKLLLVAPIAAAAYVATVVVNGLRIALGIALHESPLSWGWVTPERLHRGAGIALYFLALVTIQALARRIVPGATARRPPGAGFAASPLLWYGLVAVALPLANGALFESPGRFLEHGAWVLALALLLAAFLHAARPALRAMVRPPPAFRPVRGQTSGSYSSRC